MIEVQYNDGRCQILRDGVELCDISIDDAITVKETLIRDGDKPVPDTPDKTEGNGVSSSQLLPCGCRFNYCSTDRTGPVFWNQFNGVVQCHMCGQTYTPTTDHVAWLRFENRGENTVIKVCDSDSQGAFKVYRLASAPTPSPTRTQPATEARHGIYIASKTKHAAKWKVLRAAGVPIISTWIDEAGEGETVSYEDLWRRCVAESKSAASFIVYAEAGETLKGALVEMGAAIAAGTPVFSVGEIGKPLWESILTTKCATIEEALTLANHQAATPAAEKEGE